MRSRHEERQGSRMLLAIVHRVHSPRNIAEIHQHDTLIYEDKHFYESVKILPVDIRSIKMDPAPVSD